MRSLCWRRRCNNAQNYRQALNAYKASLELESSVAVQAAYDDLKARQGFRVTGNTLDNDNAAPRACVQFSEKLVKSVDYSPFVTVNGAAPKGVEAKDNQICVEGLDFGQRYHISLRAGLPSSVDEDLASQVDLDIYVKDRTASSALPATILCCRRLPAAAFRSFRSTPTPPI